MANAVPVVVIGTLTVQGDGGDSNAGRGLGNNSPMQDPLQAAFETNVAIPADGGTPDDWANCTKRVAEALDYCVEFAESGRCLGYSKASFDYLNEPDFITSHHGSDFEYGVAIAAFADKLGIQVSGQTDSLETTFRKCSENFTRWVDSYPNMFSEVAAHLLYIPTATLVKQLYRYAVVLINYENMEVCVKTLCGRLGPLGDAMKKQKWDMVKFSLETAAFTSVVEYCTKGGRRGTPLAHVIGDLRTPKTFGEAVHFLGKVNKDLGTAMAIMATHKHSDFMQNLKRFAEIYEEKQDDDKRQKVLDVIDDAKALFREDVQNRGVGDSSNDDVLRVTVH